MEDERRFSPIILAAVILAAPLVLYVAGYFGLSNPGTITTVTITTVTTVRGPTRLARFFPNSVWADIYRPAAAVESAVRSREVVASYQAN